MKKITILALHLGYGGVEKSIADLCNMLHNDFEIEIAVLYKVSDKPAFYIPDNVKINYLMGDLKENRAIWMNYFKSGKLYKCFKEGIKSIKVLYYRHHKMIDYIKECSSDIIISTRIAFTGKLSKYGSKNSVKIAQEHRHHQNNSLYIKRLKTAIKNIDYLMPVSQELTEYYEKHISNSKTKFHYIPHCLDYIPKDASDLNETNIISIGRLSKEKGFLDLIDVFEKVSSKYPNWVLNIVGDGPEKEKIIERIKQKKIENKINLLGFLRKDEINKLLKKSSIYLMTSYTESFGIVLLEAGSFGIPAIAFSSAEGAKEIITNGENGFLINNRDINKMSEKTIEIIKNSELRNKLGKDNRKKSLNYSIDTVKKRWLNLLENIQG
jgi:N-acetylglucosaminyldiphosphoundecaprenol N-acetyl-beta-D-mannosaminyltransferase